MDKEIVANGYRFKILSLGNKTIGKVRAEKIKKETNDKTRGDGSFEKTFKAINIIKNSGIPLRIITVLSKNNYDEIPELATTIHEELGLGFRLLPNIIEYGKGVTANDEHGI